MPRTALLSLALLLACSPAAGPPATADPPAAADSPAAAHLPAPLPPELPWEGASLERAAGPEDPWITPAEASGFERTPSYDETVAYLSRLVAAAPELEMISLGKSHEGRDLWLVVASRDKAFTPDALRAAGKPVLFAQAGIHSGEIDGKDAGLMLLRDLTVGGRERRLLDRASLLFLPILNPDGHERSSPWSRMNQRGPAEMGWRTNARNLNLNRDYAKLDTPEVRAVVAALDRWRPDLYLDLHVTDGADYQYDITFGANGPGGWSPAVGAWFRDTLRPALEADLEAMGHVPGPLIFGVDPLDLSRGIVDWTASPRFSNGYGDARHLPTVLVENHSLKPYRQRVLGTYVLLASCLETLASQAPALAEAAARDRSRRPPVLPLAFRPASRQPETVELLAVESERVRSPLTGGEYLRWTGRPVRLEVPLIAFSEAAVTARRPRAYWIPPAWDEVIERLALHGVEMERLETPRRLEVEMYRLEEVSLEPGGSEEQPYEGRMRVSARPAPDRRGETFPAGSVRVPADQPLGDLAMLLLEPASPDSFFQWGFFLPVLQRTEYAESYVLEPLAERMLAEDPGLAAELERARAADPDLAADPDRLREWLYRRTPWWDKRHLLYPVGREID